MTKRRWMKSVLETANAQQPALPWERGARRMRWKKGAKARAMAA